MLEVEEVDEAVTPQHLVGKVRGASLGKNWTEREMSLSYFEILETEVRSVKSKKNFKDIELT